jgi:hypothetical protein
VLGRNTDFQTRESGKFAEYGKQSDYERKIVSYCRHADVPQADIQQNTSKKAQSCPGLKVSYREREKAQADLQTTWFSVLEGYASIPLTACPPPDCGAWCRLAIIFSIFYSGKEDFGIAKEEGSEEEGEWANSSCSFHK